MTDPTQRERDLETARAIAATLLDASDDDFDSACELIADALAAAREQGRADGLREAWKRVHGLIALHIRGERGEPIDLLTSDIIAADEDDEHNQALAAVLRAALEALASSPAPQTAERTGEQGDGDEGSRAAEVESSRDFWRDVASEWGDWAHQLLTDLGLQHEGVRWGNTPARDLIAKAALAAERTPEQSPHVYRNAGGSTFAIIERISADGDVKLDVAPAVPPHTAEQERADVVAWLRESGRNPESADPRWYAQRIAKGEHAGAAERAKGTDNG